MSTIELNVCPHEAGTIITVLTERLHSMQMNAEEYTEYIALVVKERDELQAELDGMNAGARLRLDPNFSRMASNLSDAITEWVRQINGRLNAVETLNSIDGETVRTNLTPFINTVEGWKELIDTITNPESTQEDN